MKISNMTEEYPSDLSPSAARHARQLGELFPNAQLTGKELLLSLKVLSMRAHMHAERLCSDESYYNGMVGARPMPAVRAERLTARLRDLLGSDRPWINQDPRGAALKVNLNPGERLATDWGGYGLLYPGFEEFDGPAC